MPINVWISGGPGRSRLEWNGQSYTKEELRRVLAKQRNPKINVYFSGKRPLSSKERLDVMIAPGGKPSESSRKILDQHPNATVMTWSQFVKKYHLRQGGEEKTQKSSGGHEYDNEPEDDDADEEDEEEDEDEKESSSSRKGGLVAPKTSSTPKKKSIKKSAGGKSCKSTNSSKPTSSLPKKGDKTKRKSAGASAAAEIFV